MEEDDDKMMIMAELEEEIIRAEELGLINDDGSNEYELWCQAKYDLGIHYFLTRKDPNKAIRYLNEGLMQPDASHHYYLGKSYMLIGDLQQALHHLQLSISMDPELHPRCYTTCGQVYQALKDFHKAKDMALQAARLAHLALDFFMESNCLAVAASLELVELHSYKSALERFKSSVEAAFNVEDLQKQATCLAAVNPELIICLSHFTCRNIDRVFGLDEKMKVWVEGPKSISFVRAEAFRNLGVALVILEYNVHEACKYFEEGIRLLFQQQELGSHEKGLLFNLKYTQAEALWIYGSFQNAFELFKECKLFALNAYSQVMCDILCAYCMNSEHDYNKTVEMCDSLLTDNALLLEREAYLKARLLYAKGQALFHMQETKEAISNLENARFLWETKVYPAAAASWLPWTYVHLFQAYMQVQDYPTAFDIATLLQSLELDLDFKNICQMVLGVFFSMVGDHSRTIEVLTNKLDHDELSWVQKCDILLNLGNAYCRLGDLDAALDKCDEATACIPPNLSTSDHVSLYFQAKIYQNCSLIYRERAIDAEHKGDTNKMTENCEKWLNQVQQACHIFESLNVAPLERALAYLGQASALSHLNRDSTEAMHMLRKAADLTANNVMLIAKIKAIHVSMLDTNADADAEEAEYVGREAIMAFAETQRRLKGIENAWVTFLGGDMRIAFFVLQTICVKRRKYREALIWAERSRMRLYFYLIGQNSTSAGKSVNRDDTPDDPFDRDDKLALRCLEEAVRGCTSGTVVVEYTYAPDIDNIMYIYTVVSCGLHEDISIQVKQVDVREFFKTRKNARLGKTLDATVRRTRTAIIQGKDEQAKVGLDILHRLLVCPIQELVCSCSTIIFAPHEVLSLVPFAALFNEAAGRFFIETRSVGIIPSLRTLHHCFFRQQEFSKLKSLPPAFVAGNPEPMGWGCPPLKGAAQEAVQVAKQLKVQALIGSKMTKAAVIQNLSKAGIVVLVTHGCVNDYFPHGALIMQGRKATCSEVSPNVVLLRELGVSREVTDMLCRIDEEVLTAKEIEKVGTQAGLVVLSACQTGEGQVSSEGLLGLGRAVLQAGAACAVVTLWKVDDVAMPDLITGMFKELLVENLSILDAVRVSMLRMLHSAQPIYKWAPLVAFGSPTLRISLS